MAEGGCTRVKDLLRVGDEQQPRAGHFLTEPGVVESGHDGLAGPGRRHEKVAVVTLLAGDGDELEKAFLERLWPEFDGAQHDLWPCIGSARSAQLIVELLGLVGDEVLAQPITVEYRSELGD